MKMHVITICGCSESCAWQLIHTLGKPKVNNLKFNIRKLEKTQKKSKIGEEINEIKNSKVIEKYNYTQSWLLEKISKVDKLAPQSMEFCPGKNTGVGGHSLLQKIFPTQGSSQVSCIAGRFFTVWATREAPLVREQIQITSSRNKRGTITTDHMGVNLIRKECCEQLCPRIWKTTWISFVKDNLPKLTEKLINMTMPVCVNE